MSKRKATIQWEDVPADPKPSVRDMIKAKAYEPQIPFPLREEFKHRETFTPKFGRPIEHVSFDEEAFKAARADYNVRLNNCEGQFKLDLLQELGLIGHPKADALFSLAWKHGHAAGLYEVVDRAEEFAELLR